MNVPAVRYLLGICGALAALLILPLAASAQLVQGGSLPVTPGHAPYWVYPGILGDAGGAANPQITNLGVSNPGTPFCINDVAPPAGGGLPTGAFHQLCFGAQATIGGTTGAFITYGAFGGATATGLNCEVNGTVYPCLPTGGNVAGPTSPSPTASDVACWNGGLTLRDSIPTACNMNVQPSYASAADALNNLVSNVVHPSLFGAKQDCTTNDSTALTAAFVYAATLPGFVAVDLGGKCSALGSTVTAAGANVGIINGELTPSAGFTCGNPALNFTGNLTFVEKVWFEGSGTTAHCMDGVQISGTNAWIINNHVDHFPDYGIMTNRTGQSNGGTKIIGNSLFEWGSGDTQFLAQGNFTAKAIYITGNDIIAAFNTVAWSQYPFYMAGAGNGTYIGNHPFNGCSGVSGCSRTDPIDIFIDASSSNVQFTSLYLDNGEIVLNNDNVMIRGLELAGPSSGTGYTVCMAQRIQNIAQMANDTPSLHLVPPYIGGVNQAAACPSGGGSAVPILKMISTGGNSWNTNTAALNALGQESRVFGVPTAFLDTSPNANNIAMFNGSNANACIQLGGLSSINNASWCTNGSFSKQVTDSGNASLTIDDTGLSIHGPQVTCASGCGTGATINGGNTLGHVFLGTGAATTVVINFTSPNPPTVSNIDCTVQDFSALTNVTSASVTTSALTIHLTAGTSGDKIQWSCPLEN